MWANNVQARRRNSRSNYFLPAIINFSFQHYSCSCHRHCCCCFNSSHFSYRIPFFCFIRPSSPRVFWSPRCRTPLPVPTLCNARCISERQTKMLAQMAFICNDDVIRRSASYCVPSVDAYSQFWIFFVFHLVERTRQAENRKNESKHIAIYSSSRNHSPILGW